MLHWHISKNKVAFPRLEMNLVFCRQVIAKKSENAETRLSCFNTVLRDIEGSSEFAVSNLFVDKNGI